MLVRYSSKSPLPAWVTSPIYQSTTVFAVLGMIECLSSLTNKDIFSQQRRKKSDPGYRAKTSCFHTHRKTLKANQSTLKEKNKK
jgi:hypothetical protein